ncbi:MAG TPA: pilus assembly PilX N-terminal domain-containing protein [Baekduia sp.]|uniref:pilus assembly PilX family protein n=1 Tax=Baekduia sp. TaxID=2600305 RepID=UPI002C060990|nr:pilus assembly PilX N-terminal domain-containing protein [Baekduia sp.]HMJ32720.1 pilus assembly PilX N-terminal domain-containing protein [Baekduia sp.]
MTKTRIRLLHDEDGVAIIVAVVLMALMLAMGLGAVTFVDGQSKLTGAQRQRETAFNVAEAALNAQITQISHHWAGKNGANDGGTTTHPTIGFLPCPGGAFCPSSGELTSLVPGADSNVAITWRTNVYDNSGTLGDYFADSRVGNQCGCDYNNDGKVWVRAQATVRGRTRVIVSLVQEQTQAESVPHAALITGTLTIRNNGLHNGPIIQSNGGIVAVRCDVPDGAGQPGGPPAETASEPCLGQPLGRAPTRTDADWNDLLNNQISGFQSHVDKYSAAPVFSQDQITRFVNTAWAESTYFEGCPSSLAGKVVVVNTTGNCSYSGSDAWNTTAAPGFLIFLNANSSLTLGGSTQFNGVIYHANMGVPPTLGSPTQSSASLIITSGTTLINGGVIIDGPGRMDAGESGLNIRFDDHGYDAVRSLAAAGIIQNSWREIQPGT